MYTIYLQNFGTLLKITLKYEQLCLVGEEMLYNKKEKNIKQLRNINFDSDFCLRSRSCVFQFFSDLL